MLGSLKIPVGNILSSAALNASGLIPCIVVAVIGFVIIIVLETKFEYV